MSDQGHNPTTVAIPGFGWGRTHTLDFANGGNRATTFVDIRLVRPSLLMVQIQAIPDSVAAGFNVAIEAEIYTPRGQVPQNPIVIPLGGAIVMAQTLRVSGRATSGIGKLTIMVAPWTGDPQERKDE